VNAAPSPPHPRRLIAALVADPSSTPTLVVSGEIDLATAPSLSACLALHISLASAQRATELHLDLSGVSFFSVAGLRALLQAISFARCWNLPLRVTPSPDVTRLLAITGKTHYINQ
jgi:anti-anti-sigma factor